MQSSWRHRVRIRTETTTTAVDHAARTKHLRCTFHKAPTRTIPTWRQGKSNRRATTVPEDMRPGDRTSTFGTGLDATEMQHSHRTANSLHPTSSRRIPPIGSKHTSNTTSDITLYCLSTCRNQTGHLESRHFFLSQPHTSLEATRARDDPEKQSLHVPPR